MIKSTIEYLKNELQSALDLGEIAVSLDSLKDLPDKHGQGILFSFISADEEEAPNNLPNFPIDETKGFNVAPSLAMNLKMVIVFDFDDYEKSLVSLSEVADFFRENNIFSAEEAGGDDVFPKGLTRLMVSLEQMDLERQAKVWGMFGNRHYPALFYNVRLLNVEESS